MTQVPQGALVTYAVLGPLVVRARGRPTAVGGAKERTVLAVFLARHGHVVSTDHLLDVLWGATPPRTAEKTLQVYVARLRKALEPHHPPGSVHTVETVAGGYRLATTTEQVDAARFELLVHRAGHEARTGSRSDAVATYRLAESLWRGEAYGEFTSVPDCIAEAARLTEVRSQAVEDRIDVQLGSGAAAGLVAELEQLVDEAPYRERRWAQLALALYRSGRQAEALASLERVRSLLADELGVQPGPALRRMHAAVLAQAPGLDEPTIAPHGLALPPALAGAAHGIAGRGHALARLDHRWDGAVAGHGGVVVVGGGDPHAIAGALARHALDDGGWVTHVRLSPAASPGELASGLLAALGADPHGAGEPEDPSFAATLVRLLTVAAGRPLLAVVEGAASAGDATVELLGGLAAATQSHPVLVALVDEPTRARLGPNAYAEAGVVDGVPNLPRLLGR